MGSVWPPSFLFSSTSSTSKTGLWKTPRRKDGQERNALPAHASQVDWGMGILKLLHVIKSSLLRKYKI